MGIISTVASLLSLFFPSKQSNAHSFYYTYIPQPNDNPNKSALVFFKYSSYLRGTDKTNAAPFYLSRNHKFINVDFYSSTSHKGISLYFSLIRSGDTFLPQTLKIIIKKSYLYSIKIPKAFLDCFCFRFLLKMIFYQWIKEKGEKHDIHSPLQCIVSLLSCSIYLPQLKESRRRCCCCMCCPGWVVRDVACHRTKRPIELQHLFLQRQHILSQQCWDPVPSSLFSSYFLLCWPFLFSWSSTHQTSYRQDELIDWWIVVQRGLYYDSSNSTKQYWKVFFFIRFIFFGHDLSLFLYFSSTNGMI